MSVQRLYCPWVAQEGPELGALMMSSRTQGVVTQLTIEDVRQPSGIHDADESHSRPTFLSKPLFEGKPETVFACGRTANCWKPLDTTTTITY